MTEPVHYGKKSPEFLFDMAEHLANLLEREGNLPAEQSADLAWDASEYMARHWGGITVYFPKGSHMLQARRARKIWQEFKGNNHEELARKYNYTTQWIYSLVKRMREQEAELNQGSLFDTPEPRTENAPEHLKTVEKNTV